MILSQKILGLGVGALCSDPNIDKAIHLSKQSLMVMVRKVHVCALEHREKIERVGF